MMKKRSGKEKKEQRKGRKEGRRRIEKLEI